MKFFLKGMIVGFSIAAPVGPIGLLCIRRSLSDGILIGLVTGLGAATADAIYGCVAGFGLTAVSSFLVRQQVWLGLLGGAFLCYLGYQTLSSKVANQLAESRCVNWLPAYGSTFALTLSNPLTILSFAAVFAGLGLGTEATSDYWSACGLVIGVFSGSAFWWLLLSGGVALLRSRIQPTTLGWVNRFSGGIILAFGFYAIAKSFIT